MLDRFNDLGYVVLTQVIPADDVAVTLARVRKLKKWTPIFGDGGDDGYDPYRMQREVPRDIGKKMSNLLNRYWKSFFPRSQANDWNALRSLPGGRKQQPHTDFAFTTAFPHLDQTSLPGGIIVALEPGTHLYVYGWNRLVADRREEKRIELDVGDAIMFRGDLIHAGGAYMEENIRLHAYLDVEGTIRERDMTQLKPTIQFTQDPTKCPLFDCIITGTPDTVKKHIQRCHHARFNNKPTQLSKKFSKLKISRKVKSTSKKPVVPKVEGSPVKKLA